MLEKLFVLKFCTGALWLIRNVIVMFVSLMFQVITLNRKPSLCLLHVSYQRATVTITIMSWKTFFCKYIQKWPCFWVSVRWRVFLPLLSVCSSVFMYITPVFHLLTKASHMSLKWREENFATVIMSKINKHV